jgi:PAS domain S-box-containing protein
MKEYLDRTGDSFKRLHIDRKMIGILSIFTVLGICLVISVIIATNTLSALRGFASFQTHWTEARKEASLQLANYIQTGEERYYTRFNSALETIYSAQEIRRELLKEDSDLQSVRSNFMDIHTVPADIDNMITTFNWFHNFADFKKSVRYWVVSDQYIKEMEQLASQSRQQMENGIFNSSVKANAVDALFDVDKKLTNAQHEIAAALSSGTRFLNTIILWVSSSLGLILLITGGFLSFRFLKSLKSWRRDIEISEQKYRSLFDQNPNAVYSISKDGRLLHGNEVLEKMTGYDLDELKEQQFNRFFEPNELEKVSEHFWVAVEGIPKSYETIGVRKNGERIYLEITNLPIYADNKIIGVYGIAQDITGRKEAQRRLQEQLEEKTHLLTEIHDRVKNNLALISGLIQLQRDTVEGEQQKVLLDNTVSRIHSMAMVHEQLYHTETFSSIRMDEYVQELSKSVEQSFQKKENHIKLIVDTAPVTLSINQAIPTALLLNELLSNAFKYSCNDNGGGQIKVDLFQKNDQVVLKVADNGQGLPEEYSLNNSETLGLKLANVLINQLDASFELDREGGTTFNIQFGNVKEVSNTA